MMHMTFYWGKEVTLLFDSWGTKSWTGYAVSLLVCLVVAAVYQGLENLRVRLKLLPSGNPSTSEIETPLLHSKFVSFGFGKLWAVRFFGSALFGVNSAIGYLLMLVIMSFNGGVFLAVVVGLTIGYFVFRSGDVNGSAVVDNPCACA